MGECTQCGAFVEKGRYCPICCLKFNINQQAPTQRIKAYLSKDMPSKDAAEVITTAIRENPLQHIELEARGNIITKAINVLEFIKREKQYRSSLITSSTDEMTIEGKTINVSKVTIFIYLNEVALT